LTEHSPANLDSASGQEVATMQPPSPVLPLAARQAAWNRLWQIILAEPSKPPDPPTEKAAGGEPAAEEGEAA